MAAARAVADRGVQLVHSSRSAGVVAGYHAIRAELDPMPLLAALHERGFSLVLPCMGGDSVSLTFREWTPGSALLRRKFGVEEPPAHNSAVEPTIVFAPLVAFDAEGARLGYGAGYYDAALRNMRARRKILAIGIAFDEQEFPHIPREPQDEPLDMILTPTRVIACGA